MVVSLGKAESLLECSVEGFFGFVVFYECIDFGVFDYCAVGEVINLGVFETFV